ncbi:MAG: hypothetical protein PHU91_00770 [Candidatus Omnitrophica bacterium]|nr:hypothetical protein [Candidatus Omnitrophota bacterium]MDD5236192.1 hypothetical protein [Candidatus Omnitrophota bacterium]MDD5610821.1 hypothetical protein [Candidatus Omnitrophota bacterium]
MFLRTRKGQSTLEYVVILVGVIIAIVAAKTLLAPKVKKAIGEDAASAISQSTDKFVNTLDGYGTSGGGTQNAK